MFNYKQEAERFFAYLLDLFDKKAESIEDKLEKFQQVLFIFFRVDSLIELKKMSDDERKEEQDNNDNTSNNIKTSNKETHTKYLIAFHKFLREKDFQPWFALLNEETNNFKKGDNKDVNGLMFTLINLSAINFYQSGRISDNTYRYFNVFMRMFKEKFQTSQSVLPNIKEKNIEIILKEYKDRFELAMSFYSKLILLEERLLNERDEKMIKIKKRLKKRNKQFSIKNESGEENEEENEDNEENELEEEFDSGNDENSNSLISYINENEKQVMEKEIEKGNKIILKILLRQLSYLYDKKRKLQASDLNNTNDNNDFYDNYYNLNNNTDNINLDKDDLGNKKENLEIISYEHVNLALKLLDSDDISWKGINIMNLDSDVIRAFQDLILNICKIKEKFIMLNSFRMLKKKTLGYIHRSEYIEIRKKRYMLFEENNCDIITMGMSLSKLNFSSSGSNEHYYQLNPEQRNLLIYKNLNAKEKDESKYKSINFIKIERILVGLQTNNSKKHFRDMIKKKKTIYPWQFLSITMSDRSLDFVLSEEQMTNWFYGLKFFINENYINTKVPSTFEYVASKVKMKMIYRLIEFYREQKAEELTNSNRFGYPSNVKSHVILVLEKINNYINNDLSGFLNLPFVKILCFYWRVVSQYEFNNPKN